MRGRCRRLFSVCTGSLLLLAAHSVSCAWEPPKIERLFPPGGQRGTTVEARIVGATGDGTLQVASDRKQLALTFSEKKDTVAVEIPNEAIPGIHWLRFYNESGATDRRPFFVGLMPEAVEKEPNNEPSTAQQIESQTKTISGVLEKSEDVDIFALQLSAGQTLIASVEANRQLGSPMDTVMQLLDSNGTVIVHNDDDQDFDPQIAFDIPADGIYFIRLFAFPATPNSTIKMAGAATYVYRLSLTTGPFIDYVTPAVVNPATDTAVTLRGWNLGKDARTCPLQLTDNMATIFADDIALPLRIATVEHANFVEQTGEQQFLALPSSVTGLISAPGENDDYILTATKKQQLSVSVAARSLCSQLDPVVTVTSDAGKVIKESDDRSRQDLDSEASFTIPADGDYTVTVSDRYRFGGKRFFYVLTCRENQPGFTAIVKENALVLTADKTVEVPVAINRVNGFAEKIEVTVHEVPAGVTVESAVSDKEGDSKNTVTLKLNQTKDAQPFSGAVRIVCTAPESQHSQTAEAPIENSKATTSEIWLTVVAPAPKAAEPPKSEPKEDPKPE